MRKNRPSLTATSIAIVRALESEKPPDERICYDPYTQRFVPKWMCLAFGFFIKTGYA
jgi:O-methyltransferase involved in polyketide biosynthesis